MFSAKQLLCLRNAFAKRVGQPLSHISFYCNDAEVGVSTLVTRLPFLRKGCLLLTAFFPESESLIRTCRLLCHLDSWFHANSDSGAMTFEAFSKALGQLARSKGQLCVDPKHGWEAAMGACSLDYVMKLEDFCVLSCESFECVVQIAHITEESDPLSRHVGAVSFGMQVDLTNDPEVNVGGKIRRKISGVVAGWVTMSVCGRSCFVRIWPAKLRGSPGFLMEGIEMTDTEEAIQRENEQIDEILGLEAPQEDGESEDEQGGNGESPAAVAPSLPLPVAPKRKHKVAQNQGRKAETRTKLVLKDIAKLQATTHLLVPKSAMSRVVKDIFQKVEEEKPWGKREQPLKITTAAFDILHEVCEQYVTSTFSDAQSLALHRGRVTVDSKDFQVLRRFGRIPEAEMAGSERRQPKRRHVAHDVD